MSGEEADTMAIGTGVVRRLRGGGWGPRLEPEHLSEGEQEAAVERLARFGEAASGGDRPRRPSAHARIGMWPR